MGNEEEIQKTLTEMNQRMQSFQAGSVLDGEAQEFSHYESKKKLRLAIAIVAVILTAGAFLFLISGGTNRFKAPINDTIPVNLKK